MDALEDCISRFPEAQQHFMLLASSQSAEKAMHKVMRDMHGESNSPESTPGLTPTMWGETDEPPVVTRALARSKTRRQNVGREGRAMAQGDSSPMRLTEEDGNQSGGPGSSSRKSGESPMSSRDLMQAGKGCGAGLGAGGEIVRRIESARVRTEASKAILKEKLAMTLKS